MVRIDIYENTKVSNKSGWTNKSVTWKEFIDKMSKVTLQSYNMRYYKHLLLLASKNIKDAKDESEVQIIKDAKHEIALIKDKGAFVAGKFSGDIRQDKYLMYRSMIVLDIDECDKSIWQLINDINFEHFWHTTHSHTQDNPRIRVFFPLKKVINTKLEYKYITQEFCKVLGFKQITDTKWEYVDTCSFKANQVMFYPSIPADAEFLFKHVEGELINPYDYMIDIEKIEAAKRKKAIRDIKQLGDRDGIELWNKLKTIKSPYDMGDVIGIFCRKYTISEVIEKYLNDVYEKGTQENCYTYCEGSSMNGLKIYPDKSGNEGVLCYSFHNTDSLNDGHCHNSFDILKVHRFKGNTIDTIKFIKNELGIKDQFAIKTKVNHEAYYYYYDGEGKRKVDEEKLIDHILKSPEHACFNTPDGFYKYNNGCYENISRNLLCKLISDHLHKNDTSTHYVNNLATQVGWNEIDMDELNKSNCILNFNNIMLKFDKNGEYETFHHSYKFKTTYKFQHSFTPGVQCLTWEKFLNDVLPKDQQYLLQEIIGYMLLPDNRAKKFFLLLGEGDTGKSVVLKTVVNILGKNLVSSATLQQIGSPNLRFITSTLYGKLANIVGDLPNKAIQDTGVLKMLTGDDIINAERKGKDGFQFYNKARLLCSMNQIPPSYNDKTQAFYNRFIIIPFINVIPKNKQNKNLHKQFNIEGVINWAIEGLQRLLKNNLEFSISKANIDQLEQYEKDNNNVKQFIDECLEIKKLGYMKTEVMFKCYKGFCTENGYSNLGKNKFMKEMKNLNIEYSENCIDDNNKRFRGFKNVILKDQAVDEYLRMIY